MNVGLKLFETFTLESFRNYTIFTYVSTLYLAPEFLLQIRLSDTEFHSNATRMANRNSLGFGMVYCMQLLRFFGNKVLLRISNVPIDALIHRARVVLELFVQGTRPGIELLVVQVEPQPQFVTRKKDSPAHGVLS